MTSTAGRHALVGRDPELAVLRAALSEAGSGRGALVLVTGEAGIGKSRLVEGLASEAVRGSVVLRGRALPGGGAFRPVADALVGALRAGSDVSPASLGPYAAALARLLPDWSELGTTEAPEPGIDPGLVLGEAVARFLAGVGRDRACLLVLEDLHWADADSWAMLAHLADAVRSLPVLIVATLRDDESQHAIAAALAGRPDVTSLRLGRLSSDEVHRLAHELGVTDPAVLALVDQRAEGLPFLVEELVALGRPDEVPPTVQALVADRLDGMSPQQRRVLIAAAVLGPSPDWSLLPRLTEAPEADVLDALRTAERSRLLEMRAGALAWRHALTRDAVLALTLPPERTLLSRRAAEVLLTRGRPDDDAAAAELLLGAGASDDVAALLLKIARRDIARGAFHTAERLLARVADDGPERIAASLHRVRLLCLQGRSREALGVVLPVLDEAVGEDHAELSLTLARAAVLAERWEVVQELVERAGRPHDPRAATLLADAAHGAGRIEEALSQATTAVARAEATTDAERVCDALVVLAKVQRLTDPAVARVLFDRAAQVAAEHALVRSRVEAVLGQATLDMLESEDPTRLEAAREMAERAGLVGLLTGIDLVRTDALMVSAGPDAAVPLALELVERGRVLDLPMARIAGGSVFAMAAAAAGDRARTRELLSPFEHAGGPPEAAMVPAAVQATLALATHDLRRAHAVLDAAVPAVVGHRSTAPLHHYGVWALLRTACDDRGEEARRTLAAVPAGMRRVNRAALMYAEAVAAGRDGRHDAAAGALADAEQLAASTPWLRRLLRTVALDSAVVDGWGDPVPLLRASLAEHEAFDEVALARVVRDLLRRAGAPTRRGRGESSVPSALAALGITSREADVLALLVEGATNAEIAERLFLSRRTVETHVAHLLQKTSSATRTELRTRVHDPGAN